jgi:hypothetical protein
MSVHLLLSPGKKRKVLSEKPLIMGLFGKNMPTLEWRVRKNHPFTLDKRNFLLS